ncbi:uncharacterized protein GIQ15_03583 [Arthroderma uncinatum]|uniref:uncharacterized protein n=1 Tax=Arthroderma uncinatum TaxID=74035 RepID=UPI00144A8B05|nr:uncharacterized protein GIQ15_03583 [Arthroderma uncinatum]KAF3484259.1 hypothetical protein GIQ15_03583 [Arthroderma uncinatum]
MKISIILLLVAAVSAAPLATGSSADADEAVVYPAKVDQSWVDAEVKALGSIEDADEAVVYPAKVDQSWVDAEA